MKSKSLILLSAVLTALCFLAPFSAQANPALAVNIIGKITESDGSLAPAGLTVEATISSKNINAETKTTDLQEKDGSEYNYALLLMGDFLDKTKQPNTDDQVEIVVKDENGKLVGKTSHTITAAEDGEGKITLDIQLFAPAVIDVELLDEEGNPVTSLTADSVSTAEVKVTIEMPDTEEPVTDEDVTITAKLGDVSAVTNNNDGTYTATYTAETVAGVETLTVETDVGTKTQTFTLSAGSLAKIAVEVTPKTIMGNGELTATFTATATDENDNPINDATVSFEVVEGGGTIDLSGTFTDNGKYTSTYTGPIVEAEATATIKAFVDDISGTAVIELVSEPLEENPVMAIRGAIYYEDGQTRKHQGLEVTVENLTKDKNVLATSEKLNGHDYSAVFVAFGTDEVAATTGDEIKFSVTKDGEPVEVLAPDMPYRLSSDEVKAGETVINITTDLPAETKAMNIAGKVLQEDGTPIPAGYTIKVTNPSTEISNEGSPTEGKYSVILFDPIGNKTVLYSGQTLEIEVLDETGTQRGFLSFVPTISQILDGHANAPADIQLATYSFREPSPRQFQDPIVLDEVDGTFSGDFTFKLTYDDTGDLVTDEKPSAEATCDGIPCGEVRDFINNGDGTYTATYTLNGKDVPFAGKNEVPVTFTITFQRGPQEEFSRNITDDTKPTPFITAEVFDREGQYVSAEETSDGVGHVAIPTGYTIKFDGGLSVDNVGISAENYDWDASWIVKISPQNSNDVSEYHIYEPLPFDKAGVYTLTLKVTDVAGNFSTAEFEISVGQLELGGITLDSRHYQALMDRIFYQSFDDTLAKYQEETGITPMTENIFGFIRRSQRSMVTDMIDQFVPAGMMPTIAPVIDLFINADIQPKDNVALGNFGNALMPAPLSELDKSVDPFKPLEVPLTLTSDHLSLYLQVPYENATVQFSLNGELIDATPAGDTITHTFILEEEQAMLQLPSWPGKDPNEPEFAPSVFEEVYLYFAKVEEPLQNQYGIPGTAPYDNTCTDQDGESIPCPNPGTYESIPMNPMRDSDGKMIWTVDHALDVGNHYFYYFEVKLEKPIQMVIPMPDQTVELNTDTWRMWDPRNLQIEDRGIVEYIVTDELKKILEDWLGPTLKDALFYQDLDNLQVPELSSEIQASMMDAIQARGTILYNYILEEQDPLIVSRLLVPRPKDNMSLWVGDIDFSARPDGDYTIAAVVEGKFIDEVSAQPIIVDRDTVATALSVDEGENADSYKYTDETGEEITVATVDQEGIPAILNVKAGGILDDYYGVGFQMLKYQPDTDSEIFDVWEAVISANGGLSSIIDPSLFTILGMSEEQAKSILGGIPIVTVPENGANELPINMLLSYYYSADTTSRYWLRSIAVDNAMNMGTEIKPIRLDIVPREADKTVVNLDDIIYPDTETVTLTVEFAERTAHPVDVVVQYKIDDAAWTQIGDTISLARDEAAEAKTVEWTPDFATLFQAAGDAKEIQVRAVATNALDIADPEPAEATTKLRFHPEVVAFEAQATEFSVDSGAPKGTVEFVAYTPVVDLIAPELSAIEFEVRADDGTWDSLASADTPEEVASSDATWDSLEEVASSDATHSDGAETEFLHSRYSKWTLIYDTTQAGDTITKDDGDARDYTLDENPYWVRTTSDATPALDKPHLSVDNSSVVVTAEEAIAVSVDNVDDIGPVTGTTIVSITDDAGVIEPVDGKYILGGVIKEDATYQITITATSAADPATFDQIKLFTDGEESEYVFETTEDGYVLSIDLLDFVDNGDYTIQVLAIDATGNVEDPDPELAFDITIANFEPPVADEFEAISEIESTIGKFTLADAEKPFPASGILTFSLVLPGVEPDEIDLLYELIEEYSMSNRRVMSNRLQEAPSAKDAGLLKVTKESDTFTLEFDTTKVSDDIYNFEAQVTKRTAEHIIPLLEVAIDNTAPEVVVAAPADGIEVSPLPTIVITYSDAGTGITVPDSVSIEVKSLPDDTVLELESQIDGEKAICNLSEALNPGAYQISVTVIDDAANENSVTSQFTVGEEPIEEDTSPPLILSTSPQGMLTSADVTISAVVIDEKINDESGVATVTVSIDDGGLQEMVLEGTSAAFDTTLEDGTHNVKVTATDNHDNDATAEWSFSVDLDKTAPIISTTSPQSVITTDDVTLSVAFSDESGIESAEVRLDGGTSQDMVLNDDKTGATYDATNLSEDTHTAEVTVTDASASQNKATYEWSFIVDLDTTRPTITTSSPQGVVTTEDVTLSVGFNDESGIYRARVRLDGGSLRTMDLNDDETGATYDATNLDEGTHTAEVTVTDNSASRNDATYEWSFIVDLDLTPPTISTTSPQGVVTEEDVTLSAAFNDESGIYRARVSIDGGSLHTMTLNSDKTGATYSETGLDEGTHTAEITVTDASANRNDATYQWSFIVDLDTTPPSITSTSPVGIIRAEKPMIAVTVNDESGVDSVSVSIDGPVNINNKKMDLDETSATYEVTTSLKEGTYNVTVTATDDSANKNKATAQWSFTVEFDTDPPEISIVSPVAGSRITNLKPKIIANYSDASEIDEATVNLTITDPTGSCLICAAEGTTEISQNKVSYDRTAELENYGEYTIELEVSDIYGNQAVAEWSFYVESAVAGIEVPRNFPNPFKVEDGTTIAFTLTKQARVTIKIYDMTSRLVVKPVEDEMMASGPQKVTWDAKSENGDELAKGVYFCQIIADGGLKTEQAVIKIALFR